METFGKITAALIGIVVAALWFGFVVTKMWHWHLEPLGLPSITIKQAIGLSFTIGLFKNNPPSSEKKPFGEAVATALLTGAFVLFMGWIIHII